MNNHLFDFFNQNARMINVWLNITMIVLLPLSLYFFKRWFGSVVTKDTCKLYMTTLDGESEKRIVGSFLSKEDYIKDLNLLREDNRILLRSI